MKKILVTGSSGLIGSEVCEYFSEINWEIHGLDNNQRKIFLALKEIILEIEKDSKKKFKIIFIMKKILEIEMQSSI